MTDDSLAVSSSPSTLLIRHDMVFAATLIWFYFIYFLSFRWKKKKKRKKSCSADGSSAPQRSQASAHSEQLRGSRALLETSQAVVDVLMDWKYAILLPPLTVIQRRRKLSGRTKILKVLSVCLVSSCSSPLSV